MDVSVPHQVKRRYLLAAIRNMLQVSEDDLGWVLRMRKGGFETCEHAVPAWREAPPRPKQGTVLPLHGSTKDVTILHFLAIHRGDDRDSRPRAVRGRLFSCYYDSPYLE